MLPISKIVLMLWLLVSLGCGGEESVSATGVSAAVAKFETDEDGHTVEQANILKRYEMDNKRGSVKHLYIISAMSGQTILYSTVDGKVTSSSKRLTPLSVRRKIKSHLGDSSGMVFKIGDDKYVTTEVIQDDGTFGSSVQYLYWFDVRGVYHQHYVSGGQIIHVSSEPINVKGIIINLEKDSSQ